MLLKNNEFYKDLINLFSLVLSLAPQFQEVKRAQALGSKIGKTSTVDFTWKFAPVAHFYC